MAEGFFGRWSQRKLSQRQEKPLVEPVPAAEPVLSEPALAARAQTSTLSPGAGTSTKDTGGAETPPPAAAPLPTMQDVAGLHKDSDFRPFVSRAVQPDVRNAALKKMFSDPHFNVMDGLDTYIDDYSQPDPLPMAMLRKMASAQVLGLFDHEKEDASRPLAGADDGPAATTETRGDGDAAARQVAALSTPHPEPGATSTHDDDDTDLRLQPDDATGPAGAGRGTE